MRRIGGLLPSASLALREEAWDFGAGRCFCSVSVGLLRFLSRRLALLPNFQALSELAGSNPASPISRYSGEVVLSEVV